MERSCSAQLKATELAAGPCSTCEKSSLGSDCRTVGIVSRAHGPSRPTRARRLPPSRPADGIQAPAAAAQTLLEELLELGVEDGVDDGVDGAVDVAQPGDGAHQPGGDVAGGAQRSGGVDHEERRPAEEEATCAQRRDSESGFRSRATLNI